MPCHVGEQSVVRASAGFEREAELRFSGRHTECACYFVSATLCRAHFSRTLALPDMPIG